MNRTNIEYLDFTSNPIVGCDMSLPCAERCWARRMAHRLKSAGVRQYQEVVDREGKWTGKTAFNEAELEELLRRREPAAIGLGFMGDCFHESVPDEWLDRVFSVCAMTPHLRYLILTKRSKRMREWFAPNRWERVRTKAALRSRLQPEWDWPLSNIALGVSVEDQKAADERIPDLLATPAAMRFVGIEPMIGAVNITKYLRRRLAMSEIPGAALNDGCVEGWVLGLNWVILGGESGPGARPMPPEWARSVRDQCVSAGVPYFHKQNGEWSTVPNGPVTIRTKYQDVPVGDGTHHRMFPVGKKAAGRLLDGRTWDEKPEGWE